MKHLRHLFAPALLPLLLAGCAAPRPATDQAPPAHAAHAIADSLLLLPPDSLSEADVAWLRLYHDRQPAQAPEKEAKRSPTTEFIGGLIAIPALLVIGLYVLYGM